MKVSWQPVLYTDEDMDELVALSQLQPGKAAAITAEYVRWQHAANPAGLAQVALAKETTSGRIVGMVWLVPLRIQIGDEVCLGTEAINVLVHPDCRGQGVLSGLAPFCYESAQRLGMHFSFGFPNPNSYPVYVHRLNWADIGSSRLFIRPLNVGRLVTRRMGRGTFAQILAAAGRAGRRFLFRPHPVGPGVARAAVAEVDTEDGALDDFWRRVRGKYPVMVIRDTRFLHWRYTQVPGREYLVLAAWLDKQIVAYGALRCVAIEGVDCGMVVDLLVEPTERGRLAGEALLQEATAHFQHKDVDIAGCLISPGAEEIGLLRRQGYVLCPTRFQPQPFPVLLRSDEGINNRHLLHDIRYWFLTMGDFDAV